MFRACTAVRDKRRTRHGDTRKQLVESGRCVERVALAARRKTRGYLARHVARALGLASAIGAANDETGPAGPPLLPVQIAAMVAWPAARSRVSSVPPHSPHVAMPASRCCAVVFGGRPAIRPSANRSVLPAVSARRACTRLQSSSDTMRRSSFTGSRNHSDSGRRCWFTWRHSSRFRERFQTTTPRYNSRCRIARTVVGDQPRTGCTFVGSFRTNGLPNRTVGVDRNPRKDLLHRRSRSIAASSLGLRRPWRTPIIQIGVSSGA